MYAYMDYSEFLVYSSPRGPGWTKLAREWITEFPNCAACGGRTLCVPHHIIPFHVDPTHEMDRNNLMTLCSAHHIWVGHLGDFRSWNVDAKQDAKVMLAKIKVRPYTQNDLMAAAKGLVW